VSVRGAFHVAVVATRPLPRFGARLRISGIMGLAIEPSALLNASRIAVSNPRLRVLFAFKSQDTINSAVVPLKLSLPRPAVFGGHHRKCRRGRPDLLLRHRPQSSSASRFTAGASGFFILSHQGSGRSGKARRAEPAPTRISSISLTDMRRSRDRFCNSNLTPLTCKEHQANSAHFQNPVPAQP
jgi:hypothetical protein